MKPDASTVLLLLRKDHTPIGECGGVERALPALESRPARRATKFPQASEEHFANKKPRPSRL
jgi:hypothetical protein